MNSIILPKHDKCTGCGACKGVCPQTAIQMIPDEMNVFYPHIDERLCVKCGQCQDVCHLLKNLKQSKSEIVFAAYSVDEEDRAISASGGIATALYKLAKANKWHSYGVEYARNVSCKYKELVSEQDYLNAKNSKYVFCDSDDIFQPILNQIKRGETVLFIGLPCQVASVVAFVGNRKDNLITVDLLCHGACPVSYLEAHISYLENKLNKKAEEICFRDPIYETNTYSFTLKNKGKVFYKATPDQPDVYQIGYHKGLIYKGSCYNCKYASEERVGDLTISDFSGLGKLSSYAEKKKSVSCIVVSSERGKEVLDLLIEKKLVIADRRPSNEAFKYDKMFQHATEAHVNREVFKRKYLKTKDFELAARVALRSELNHNYIMTVLHIKEMRAIASKIKHLLFH